MGPREECGRPGVRGAESGPGLDGSWYPTSRMSVVFWGIPRSLVLTIKVAPEKEGTKIWG